MTIILHDRRFTLCLHNARPQAHSSIWVVMLFLSTVKRTRWPKVCCIFLSQSKCLRFCSHISFFFWFSVRSVLFFVSFSLKINVLIMAKPLMRRTRVTCLCSRFKMLITITRRQVKQVTLERIAFLLKLIKDPLRLLSFWILWNFVSTRYKLTFQEKKCRHARWCCKYWEKVVREGNYFFTSFMKDIVSFVISYIHSLALYCNNKMVS